MIKSTLFTSSWKRFFTIMATSSHNLSRQSSTSSSSGSADENNEETLESSIGCDDKISSQSTDHTSTKDVRETVKSNLSQRTFAGTPFTELSKKAQKKLIQIHVKRHFKKSAKKSTSTMTTNSVATTQQKPDTDRPSKLDIKKERTQKMLLAREQGQKLAIDCSLEDTMTPKQLYSLARQIRYIYSSNLRSSHPFRLHLTGLANRGKLYQACSECFEGFDHVIPDITDTSFHDYFDKEQLVYLTPDSPNDLATLDHSKVYVLGGLVDRGDHWGFTYSNAIKMGLSTAKLPIDRYMEKVASTAATGSDKSRDVALTINQVFEMLLDVKDGKSWEDTLTSHLPKRKGFQLKTPPAAASTTVQSSDNEGTTS